MRLFLHCRFVTRALTTRSNCIERFSTHMVPSLPLRLPAVLPTACRTLRSRSNSLQNGIESAVHQRLTALHLLNQTLAVSEHRRHGLDDASSAECLRADSTKRKRRRKMNRHKLRKRRKANRCVCVRMEQIVPFRTY